MTWPGGTDRCAANRPLRTNTQGKDVDVDDIPVRHHTPDHVVHLQLQDGVEWAHRWKPHLAHNAWERAEVVWELAETEATWRPGTRFPSGNFRAAGALGPQNRLSQVLASPSK